ncbi:hypothetical protein PTSG_05516 [Salpingoeca rosetta]|uniref:MORN repeat-containing protein 4 n=1 Tax=Salpingoeca rosetta (strain ATCC 50818 / BSB-021) TaxID=946362 RepID=F2UBF6_SALR5|nr:uncharacterized protein PTSG_05516 [Salpingoeca rosetta]EGD73822.1 hypothetical protein PTSG_05516 [Salpingoeca rosetta]|eukprot:XP_004993385.1 hypothetical protein PTSG_05516 [Salpingoeca rosetta]
MHAALEAFRKRVYDDESMYIGEWSFDQREGFGLFRFKDGSVYIGEFVEGVPQGFGVHTLVSGSCYAGQFVEGLYQGYGVYTRVNKTQFLGAFKHGIPDGAGRLVTDKGNVKDGLWKGNTILKFGEVANAVAAARACAEAAHDRWQKARDAISASSADQ